MHEIFHFDMPRDTKGATPEETGHITNNVPAVMPVHHKNSKDNQDKVMFAITWHTSLSK
jgi:hypothetical protein